MRTMILALVLLLSSNLAVAVERADQAGQPNAFTCSFEGGYFTVFENNGFKSEPGRGMAFVIASINLDDGTAQLVGNIGTSDLILLPGRENLHFLEQTTSGNLNLTTVYNGAAPDGRFIAVHSRYVGTGADPWLSQFYGLCEGLW